MARFDDVKPARPVRSTRVCHVAGSALSVRELLSDQLEYLVTRGFEVDVMAPAGPEMEEVRARGLRWIPVPVGRTPSLRSPVTFVDLVRSLTDGRYDIVHTHNPLAGLLGRFAGRAAGPRAVVHTVHGWHFEALGSQFSKGLARRTEGVAAHITDRLLFQSEEDMDEAMRLGLDRRASFTWIGNGVDLERFDPSRHQNADLPISDRRSATVVGFVGRVSHPRKGYLDFVEASRILSARDQRLVFLTIGRLDENAEDSVRRELARARSHPRHIVHDWIPNENLPSYYNAMDVLVLPSLFEGLPRVVMEASVMGVPVVASDVTGNREAVPPFPPNRLVSFGNPSALARAIEEAVSWSRQHGGIPEAARAWARRMFDQRKVFETVASVYRELI